MQDLIPFIMGLFVLAALLRIDFYFSIVYLLAGVYVLARMWTRRAMGQLHAERRLVKRAFPGERIPVELVVRNTGWLPVPWVELNDSLPVQLISPPFYREVMTLSGLQERRFRYTLSCDRRGYYDIGPLQLHTGDLLGVAPRLTFSQQAEYVIVYPRVLPLQALGLPTHSPLAVLRAPSPLFEDPTRVMGVRNYIPGDSPRRIHWTATANTGQLLVKRYQPAIARETLICLDLDAEGYDNRQRYSATELAIVAAASIANHVVIREGLAVGLVTQALDPLQEAAGSVRFALSPRRERGQLMAILEVLARAQVFDRGPTSGDVIGFPEFLRQQGVALSWGTTLVVITGSETESLFDSLAYLRRMGFAVALILVMPARAGDAVQQQAEVLGVPVYRIWRECDLDLF
ncbi:MAG: DUF58 domain-containing protein [Anaerolineae bacterium]|nr:DUF58 domain-containing protein [Anaerolineae bacterium]